MQSELDAFYTEGEKADRFIELVRRYTEFDELTAPMLNEFVSKVLIHEADKSTGERTQKVEIFLNIIDDFDIPTVADMPLPEESVEQEKLSIKRAKQREANRRWYAKQKEKRELEKRKQQLKSA